VQNEGPVEYRCLTIVSCAPSLNKPVPVLVPQNNPSISGHCHISGSKIKSSFLKLFHSSSNISGYWRRLSLGSQVTLNCCPSGSPLATRLVYSNIGACLESVCHRMLGHHTPSTCPQLSLKNAQLCNTSRSGCAPWDKFSLPSTPAPRSLCSHMQLAFLNSQPYTRCMRLYKPCMLNAGGPILPLSHPQSQTCCCQKATHGHE
jgi:hypothetical protein